MDERGESQHSPIGIRDLGPAAFLILLDVWFFARHFVRQQLLLAEDVLLQNFPMADLLHRGLLDPKTGVPFWTDQVFCGYPIFADPQAAYAYPPNLLLCRFLDTFTAFTLGLALHHLLLMLSTYFLIRKLKLGWGPGLLGGVIIGYCGYTTGHLVHQNLMFCLPYLPLLLVSALHYSNPRRDDFLWEICNTSLLVGLSILGGHAQTTAISLVAWILFKITLTWYREHEDSEPIHTRNTLFWSSLSPILLGVGLAAVQLLPTLELVGNSQRAATTAGAERDAWSIGVTEVSNLVFPFLMGSETAERPYFGRGSAREFSFYVGIIPLLLIWLMRGSPLRSGQRRFFALLTFLGLLLSMGSWSPLGFVHHLPPFSNFRNPCRFLMLVDLGLAVWAAHAFRALLDRSWDPIFPRRLERYSAQRLLVEALVLLGLVWAMSAHFDSRVRSRIETDGEGTTVTRPEREIYSADALRTDAGRRLAKTFENAATQGLPLAMFLIVGAVLVRLHHESSIHPRLLVLYVVGFTFIDVGGFHASRFWDRTPVSDLSEQEVAPPLATLQRMPDTAMFRVLIEPLGENRPVLQWMRYRSHLATMLGKIRAVGGYAPLTPSRWIEFFKTGAEPADQPYNRELQVLARIDPVKDRWKLDLANCRYVVSPGEAIPETDEKLRLVQPELLANPGAMGRAYLVREIHPLSEGQPMLPLLEELNRRLPTVVVEDPTKGNLIAGAVGVLGDSVFPVVRGPGRMSLFVSAATPAYLVIPDLRYPGWRAVVEHGDTKEAVPILDVNEVFLGIKLEAGNSNVFLDFEPRPLREGLIITLCTAFALFFVWIGLLYSSLRYRRTARRGDMEEHRGP